MLSLLKIKLLSYFLPDYTLLAVLDFWGTWMNSKFILPSQALPNTFPPYIFIHSSLLPHSYFIEWKYLLNDVIKDPVLSFSSVAILGVGIILRLVARWPQQFHGSHANKEMQGIRDHHLLYLFFRNKEIFWKTLPHILLMRNTSTQTLKLKRRGR